MDNNDAEKGISPSQQLHMALEEFRKEVKLLVDAKVTKPAKALPKLLPYLDKLNDMGLPQQQLVEEMDKIGLSMSLGYFKTAIWRLRKKPETEK